MQAHAVLVWNVSRWKREMRLPGAGPSISLANKHQIKQNIHRHKQESRDQRGRGGENPNLSPTVSSFNSNTNIRDGERGGGRCENNTWRRMRESCTFPHHLRPAGETNSNKQVTARGLLGAIFHSWEFSPFLHDHGSLVSLPTIG